MASPPLSPLRDPILCVTLSSTVLEPFISAGRAGALAIAEFGVAAFFVAGATALVVAGAWAPWLVLAAAALVAVVRAVDIDAWSLLIPVAPLIAVKQAFGSRQPLMSRVVGLGAPAAAAGGAGSPHRHRALRRGGGGHYSGRARLLPASSGPNIFRHHRGDPHHRGVVGFAPGSAASCGGRWWPEASGAASACSLIIVGWGLASAVSAGTRPVAWNCFRPYQHSAAAAASKPPCTFRGRVRADSADARRRRGAGALRA